MTILTVVQDVSMAVGLARPSAVINSTVRQWQEMTTVANEAAAVIVEAFDWQRLKSLATLTGNGFSGSFPLPSNYGRMLKTGSLWSSRYRWKSTHIVNLDDWLEMTEYNAPVVADGIWTIYGDELHFRPTLEAGGTLKFFYIKNEIVMGPPEAPVLKTSFTNDNDTFRLNERILKLCIIYMWKQLKGLDFAAELADYEQAIDQAMLKDQGSLPTVSGNTSRRPSSNVWPGKVIG